MALCAQNLCFKALNPFFPGFLCPTTRAQDGKLSDARRMGAGFAAGVTEALLIVTPFEVVKIRLQQQQGIDKSKLLYKVRSEPSPRV